MKFSIWPGEHYPIYINPTWDEVLELTTQQPDTLRILESIDETHEIQLAVASGYGNTHITIASLIKDLGYKNWSATPLILYQKTRNNWKLNPDGLFRVRGEPEDAITPHKAKKLLNNSTWEFIQDFIKQQD